MSGRPSWEERMLRLAEHWAQYSTCRRRQVGAVVFDPATKAVLGLGYNDTPIGYTDCGEGGCEICGGSDSTTDLLNCLCVHAEMNAVLLAGRSLRGAVLALASLRDGHPFPKSLCENCEKHLRQAGLAAAIWMGHSGLRRMNLSIDRREGAL